MTAFRRFLSLASATVFAAAVFLSPRPASAVNYAVSVGINTYKSGYASSLTGSVPDAQHMTNLVTSRGQWDADKVTLLTNSGATLTKIRQAISNCASQAASGDTFLYYHSSHGGNGNYSYVTNKALYTDYPIIVYDVDPDGVYNFICSYNANYTAAQMATDLAAFDPGVKIIVMLDTCHSAGMFKYNTSRAGRRNSSGGSMHSADPSLFASAVNAQLGAIRRARGIRAASNVGFVTAANFDEYSWDGDNGGAFTEAFIYGVTNGVCDSAQYGDRDGWASFYEGWNYAKDIATGLSKGDSLAGYVTAVDANGYALCDNTEWSAQYEDEPDYYYDYCRTHAQMTNEAVLRAVLVGWAGKTAPSVAPTFPSATATASGYVGDPIAYTFSASGSTPITYSITSSTAPASTYSISSGVLSFTPASAGTFTFVCTAANGISPNATCTLTVTVTEPPPATPEVPSTPPSASTTSFTATWSAVSDAASYNLYVEQKVAASTSSRAARDASAILSDDFSHFTATGSSYSSSTASQTVDSGTWSYENVILSPTGAANGSGSAGFAQLKASEGYLYLPAVDTPSSLSVVARASAGSLTLEQKVSGTWTEIGSWSLSSSGTEYTHTFTNAGTAAELRFAAASKATYIHDITVFGDSASWTPVSGYYPVSVSGTSKTVSGLSAGTEYRYSVAAVNAAGVESEPSSYVPVTTADADSAPVWSALPNDASVTVGGTYTLDLSTYVAGSPTPIISLTTQPSGVNASISAAGVFSFVTTASTTPGSYEFVFTADNEVSPAATATLTVSVSAAPVTVPVLLVDDVTATTAYATWSECTGVTTYTLQLASDNQFTTGGSGAAVLEETFESTSVPSGWTISDGGTYGSSPYVSSTYSRKFTKVDQYAVTPDFGSGSALQFWAYGNGGSGSIFTISGLVNSVWTFIDTVSIAQNADTYEVTLPSGTSQIGFYFTTRTYNCALDDVTVTGASGTGSLILEETVSDDEYTFTGLTPDTTYYARVKGDDGWSNVEEFTTESAGDSAPVWSTLPVNATAYVGELYELTLTDYVTASPAATITLVSATADGAAYTAYQYENGYLVFSPEAQVAYVFNFSAANGIGDAATASLTVTGVADSATLSIPSASVTATVGELCTFNATFGGRPTPTFSLTSDYPDSALYSISTNGVFEFIPESTGEYSFTLTAANVAATVSQQFTVTVSEAPVSVPTLTITDITDTSALATWTACDDVTSYTLQLSTNEFSAGAATITDTLTAAKLGLGGSYGAGSYASDDSGAEYAAYGMTKSGGTAIQIRSNDSQSGIVVTKSAGTVSEVRVSFESGTQSGRTLNIYGSSSAYSSAADLYSASTPLGTIVYDGSNAAGSYTINGSYAFIGLRSDSGAIYLDNVEIDWTPANGTTSKGLAKDGDGIQTFNVTDTSYEFTDLTPETTYYARVKGDDDWSNVETFTTLAGADSAPVWSAIPAQNYLFGSNNGTFEFNVAPYASGSPSPAFYLGDTQWTAYVDDGNGDFIFEPEALGTFDFTVIASNTLGTANATLSVTVTAAPPAFVDLPSTVTGYAGEDVTFTVVATGNPAPVLDVDAADGLLFDFNPTTGLFEFNSDNTGDFEFEFTAANIAATVTQTVTVTISPAPVTVPELTVTDITDTTALATWTACDGVSSYTLQLATNDFPAASGASARSATPILAENFSGVKGTGSTAISDFDSVMGTNGWSGTFVYPFNGAVRLGKGSGAGSLQTPAIEVGETVRVAWSACWWTNDSTKIYVGVSTDNGTTFDETEVQLSDAMKAYTNNFTVTGSPAIVRWRSSAASNQRFFLDDIAITTFGDTPAGDDIQEFTVAGTSYEFTGLTPNTVYYARVKGNADWSDTEEFITEEAPAPGIAPAWSAIPAQSVTVGQDCDLDLAPYVSGTDPITLSMAATEYDAVLVGTEFSFTPDTDGSFTFTFTAANDFGAADATLTVTVTAPPSDFELWLAAHNASGRTADEIADNGHTYWDNYIADIDPDATFLSLVPSETAGYLDIENASQNRYYQFIYYTNLLAAPVIQELGPGYDEMRVPYPVDGTFFARILVFLDDPSPQP